MGRPRIDLTDDQVEQVEKLAAVMTQDQIADFLGICEKTLRTRMKEDERVLTAYARGRARAIAGAGQNLLKQGLGGNTRALEFYLKTQAGWKETVVQEHTGAGIGVLAVPVAPDAAQWAAGAAAQQAALVARPATAPEGDEA